MKKYWKKNSGPFYNEEVVGKNTVLRCIKFCYRNEGTIYLLWSPQVVQDKSFLNFCKGYMEYTVGASFKSFVYSGNNNTSKLDVH